MGNGESAPKSASRAVGEDTPLLLDDRKDEVSTTNLNFRRSTKRSRRGSSGAFAGLDTRSSVRVTGALFTGDQDAHHNHHLLRPIDALAPLVAGGIIVATDGYKTPVRSPSVVKSLPAVAPFPRMARHRSFALWWLNEFRHWWKSR